MVPSRCNLGILSPCQNERFHCFNGSLQLGGLVVERGTSGSEVDDRISPNRAIPRLRVDNGVLLSVPNGGNVLARWGRKQPLSDTRLVAIRGDLPGQVVAAEVMVGTKLLSSIRGQGAQRDGAQEGHPLNVAGGGAKLGNSGLPCLLFAGAVRSLPEPDQAGVQAESQIPGCGLAID